MGARQGRPVCVFCSLHCLRGRFHGRHAGAGAGKQPARGAGKLKAQHKGQQVGLAFDARLH